MSGNPYGFNNFQQLNNNNGKGFEFPPMQYNQYYGMYNNGYSNGTFNNGYLNGCFNNGYGNSMYQNNVYNNGFNTFNCQQFEQQNFNQASNRVDMEHLRQQFDINDDQNENGRHAITVMEEVNQDEQHVTDAPDLNQQQQVLQESHKGNKMVEVISVDDRDDSRQDDVHAVNDVNGENNDISKNDENEVKRPVVQKKAVINKLEIQLVNEFLNSKREEEKLNRTNLTNYNNIRLNNYAYFSSVSINCSVFANFNSKCGSNEYKNLEYIFYLFGKDITQPLLNKVKKFSLGKDEKKTNTLQQIDKRKDASVNVNELQCPIDKNNHIKIGDSKRNLNKSDVIIFEKRTHKKTSDDIAFENACEIKFNDSYNELDNQQFFELRQNKNKKFLIDKCQYGDIKNIKYTNEKNNEYLIRTIYNDDINLIHSSLDVTRSCITGKINTSTFNKYTNVFIDKLNKTQVMDLNSIPDSNVKKLMKNFNVSWYIYVYYKNVNLYEGKIAVNSTNLYKNKNNLLCKLYYTTITGQPSMNITLTRLLALAFIV